MKGFFILTFLILAQIFIISACEEGQIDINSASAAKLDELYGIGPVKAEAIIDARPFDSVDALIDVNGIGEATLEGIKSQGLACVESNQEEGEEEEIEREIGGGPENSGPKIRNLEPISLDAEVIKTKAPAEVKSTIALYGLGAFAILLCLLFLIKPKKNGLA